MASFVVGRRAGRVLAIVRVVQAEAVFDMSGLSQKKHNAGGRSEAGPRQGGEVKGKQSTHAGRQLRRGTEGVAGVPKVTRPRVSGRSLGSEQTVKDVRAGCRPNRTRRDSGLRLQDVQEAGGGDPRLIGRVNKSVRSLSRVRVMLVIRAVNR